MSKHKILYVEDEVVVLLGISKELEAAGYEVTTATSGEKAIKLLEKESFDLVISDVVMGEVDGFEVVEKAKELCPETITMILTGYEETDFAIKALRLGVDDYMLKPYETEDFSFRVKRCLEKGEFLRKNKQTEAELLFLSSAIKQSTEGIGTVDLEGNLIFVNEAMAAMHGYLPEELIGKYLSIFHTPEQMADVEKVNKLTQEKGEFIGEIWHVRKDGTIFPGIMHNSIIQDDNGNPIGMTGTLRDITERKRAEEEIKASEARFKELFNNMSSGVAVYEAKDNGNDFIFKDFNRAGERIENIKKEDLIGKSVLEMFSGVKEFGLFDVFKRVWETGKPEHHPISLYKDKRIVGWRENYVYKLPSGEIVAVYDDVTEHKRMEEALRESEEQYRELADSITDVFFAMDRDLKYTYWNKASEKLTGISAKEAIGKSLYELFPEVEGTAAEKLYLDVLKTKKARSLENKYRLGNQDFIFELSAYPTKDGCSVFTKDITARKRTELALEESEKRFRGLFETMAEGVVLISSDGKIVKANPAAERILGLRRPEIEARNYVAPEWEIVRPDGTPMPLEEMAGPRAMKEKRPVKDIVMGVRHPDGAIFWINVSAVPIINQAGELECVVGSFADITKLKKAEEALKETSNYLENLLTYANAPIIVWDPEFRISRFNRAFESLTGKSADNVLGTPLDILFPEDRRKEAMDHIHRTMAGERWEAVEIPILRADGAVRTVLWNSATLYASDGTTVVAIIAQGQDITGRKRMEEGLRKSEERYRRLFEDSPISLAHEDYSEVKKHIDKLKASGVRDFRKYFAEHPEEVRRCVEMVKPVNVNKATLELYQAEKLEDFKKGIVSIFTEETFKMFEEELVALAEDKTVFDSDHAEQTFKGEKKHISMRWFMLPDSQVIIANIDITKQKRAEEQIKASLKEKEVLLQEIHHRVRNNMQVVSSLLKLQAGKIKDEKVRQAFKESQRRISAMALVHQTLYKSESMAEIGLQKHIPALVDSIYRTFRIKGKVDLQVDVEDIKLSIGQAVPLSLVINELISNSLQHAFPEGKGEITVKVHSKGEEEIRVIVSDNGPGMTEDIDYEKTLGLQLVKGLVEDQFGGTWDIKTEGGTKHTIQFKRKEWTVPYGRLKTRMTPH